ncbi:hypothetical protein O9992_16335 [Vibrio lentus]|nr:hypothetical protein [Vibrio lentus]
MTTDARTITLLAPGKYYDPVELNQRDQDSDNENIYHRPTAQ